MGSLADQERNVTLDGATYTPAVTHTSQWRPT